MKINNLYKIEKTRKKMEKKLEIYDFILIGIILISLIFLFFENVSLTGEVITMTGFATESSTTSNVSIQKYLSIALCTNLSSGISFGDVSSLPAINLNGTHNYDGTSSGTTYCLNISIDGNTAIDSCIKGSGDMQNPALDAIGLANETYANHSVSNSTDPALSEEVSLTTSYAKSGVNIAVGSLNYYRFWLDIPAAQPSGDYNNTVYFKGVQATTACG